MAARLQRTVAAIAFLLLACPAMADETGLATMHAMRREGRQLCFLDHYHYGSSAGATSQRAAKISAVKSWAGFVDLEYGSDWARYSRAHNKSMTCERSSGGWSCMVEARPCK